MARRNPWFSALSLSPYQGEEPAFYKPDDLPWADHVCEHWQAIRQELEQFLHANQGKPYFSHDLQGTPDGWTTVPLMTWGLRYESTCKHFPATLSAVKAIEGLVSVSFNTLQPGARIKPHFGDTDGCYRIHLGLQVPASLPIAGIDVNGEQRSWGEGSLLAFCDAHIHSAWNHADSPRHILLLDVIRPEHSRISKKICSMVLASLLIQYLMARAPSMRTLLFLPVLAVVHGAALAARILTVPYNWLGRMGWKQPRP